MELWSCFSLRKACASKMPVGNGTWYQVLVYYYQVRTGSIHYSSTSSLFARFYKRELTKKTNAGGRKSTMVERSRVQRPQDQLASQRLATAKEISSISIFLILVVFLFYFGVPW